MKTHAYIDASNLFYGGKKSMGWSIDYEKLKTYLENKFQVSHIYYFGGVEIHKFPYDYLKMESVPVLQVEQYLNDLLKKNHERMTDAEIVLLNRHLKRVRFYKKLEEMGYHLILKPVKSFTSNEGMVTRKANCDVDMAFYMMNDKEKFDQALFLSGDGDFLPVLKHLREEKKDILILAHADKTAKEIKQFAGNKFMDFKTGNMRSRIERLEF